MFESLWAAPSPVGQGMRACRRCRSGASVSFPRPRTPTLSGRQKYRRRRGDLIAGASLRAWAFEAGRVRYDARPLCGRFESSCARFSRASEALLVGSFSHRRSLSEMWKLDVWGEGRIACH
jgi:hypothetical protein